MTEVNCRPLADDECIKVVADLSSIDKESDYKLVCPRPNMDVPEPLLQTVAADNNLGEDAFIYIIRGQYTISHIIRTGVNLSVVYIGDAGGTLGYFCTR